MEKEYGLYKLPDSDFLLTAGFDQGEVNKWGIELIDNANLYHQIFIRMREKGLGENFWYKFRIYAGTMMRWAKDLPINIEIPDYDKFPKLLHDMNFPCFSDVKTAIGAINAGGNNESLLEKWSHTAAIMSRAQLQGKYVKFLDMCAETAVGFPAGRWRGPSYGLVKPMAPSVR